MKKEYRMKDFMLSFIKKHLFMVIVLCLLMMLCALAELLPPFALRYLIDSILLPGVEYHSSSFIFAVVFYVLSYIFISLFTILENLVIDSFGQKLIHELRYKMMKKSTRMKYSYFTHHGKGEMTSKIIDDVNAIETLFASGLVTLIISVFKVLGILISVYLFSWVLGLFLTVILPLLFYITRSFQKQMLKNQIRNRKAINKLNKTDNAVAGQVVSSVSETNGIITVTRRALIEDDIPELDQSKIIGLEQSLADKADNASLAKIAKSGNVNDLVQSFGEYIVFNCGSSTTVV